MIAALMLMLTLAGQLSAQPTIDPRTAGTLYVIAFPDTTRNLYDPRQDTQSGIDRRAPGHDSISIAIYSPVNNTVHITGAGGYSRRLTMKGGDITMVYLNDASTPVMDESGVVTGKTFRVEAESPVVIYCFMDTKFGTEAFTPISVADWGTEYYAAALPGEVLFDEIPGSQTNYKLAQKPGAAEILVVAAYDNTRITIVPNARLDRNPPVSVLLMKNQCYQVQSYVDTTSFNLGNPQPDIGGSYIYATKPIGVVSGNTRAQVLDVGGGLAKNSFKDMMIEWLAPAEEHGKRFVYLPTWDEWRPTGAPGEDPATKRQGEVVRVYATSGRPDDIPLTTTTVADLDGNSGNILRTQLVERTKFYETLIGAADPHCFTTDRPAQAFMNTTAAVKFSGTTGGIASYTGSSTYMVAMTPVEQWSYVAPYITPVDTPGMAHYLNIVTDSASRTRITVNGQPMTINRPIKGTPYYWGTRTLNPGEKGLIQGADTSAKFYATIYGGATGYEKFYTPQSNNPGFYEENIGRMYGYPVASAHAILKPADTLQIDSIKEPCRLTVRVRTLNANPAGLRSITLENAINAQLVFTDPAPPESVVGLTQAEVVVTANDATWPANATVVITDRTGKSWRVQFLYGAGYWRVAPREVLDFGQVPINTRQSKTVTVVNTSAVPVRLDTILLVRGSEGFSITDTKPPISHDPSNRTILEPGDSIVVTVELNPTIQNKEYMDTLFIAYPCLNVSLPLRAETVQPCLDVPDLDFGVVRPGEARSMPLKLCNNGRGQIRFVDPFVAWLQQKFGVSASDIDRLQTTVLGPGECITINVIFKSDSLGFVSDIAHFFVDTGGGASGCDDNSTWTAYVQPPASVEEDETAAAGLACRVEPNPFSASTVVTVRLDAPGRASVAIFDQAGARVATLADAVLEAGSHVMRWDAGALPSGIYYCRVQAGARTIVRPVLLVR
jgi:hypothetical protein